MKATFRFKYRIIFVFAFAMCFWIVLSGDDAKGFSAGAPAGYCNAPSNPGSSCFACHNTGSSPATLPGLITSDVPSGGYIPGATYTVTATITGAGHSRFGFEISPQDLSGNLMGSMNDLGAETMFQQSGIYITHSSNSTLNLGSKSWQFEWIAPVAGSGNVTFYGAFNISNNDGSYTGDTIVLSTMTCIESTGLFVECHTGETNTPVVWFASNTLHISEISSPAEKVVVYNLSGQLIWQWENSISAEGDEYVLGGVPLQFAPGIYIVNIQTKNNFWSVKMLNAN